jgi:putative DNA primase/helicase
MGAGMTSLPRRPATVENVIVARDDDPPGSPACVALGRGVARLLGQVRKVSVTPRAGRFAHGAKDLNDLLRIDVALARRQLDEAGGIGPFDKVEREAMLEEISRLPQDVYENIRKSVARMLNWRAKALDGDWGKRRGRRAQSGENDPVTKAGRIEPWHEPVTDLAGVLDAAVAQLERFLIVPSSTYLDTIALWVAHTYLLRNEAFGVGFTPLLAFQSPLKRCGKSTALKCVHMMSYAAHMVSSITPASLFRVVDEYGVTLTVDEADNALRDEKSDLLGIMNAGRDRMTAWVMRAEAVGDRKFKVREFNTFAPVALSSIKQLPDALQDRAIVQSLKRATYGERPERLTIMVRGPLIDIGRLLARWAADLPVSALPPPSVPPDLYNRIEDKWFILFQVAELAGVDWPERCRRAARADLARQEANDAGGRDADLLADVWEVFYQKNKEMVHTGELCEALVAMEESPWRAVNGGRGINGYYLRKHLAEFVPDDAEKIAPRKWREGAIEARGYHERHFEDAFNRYLGRELPSKTQKSAAGLPDIDASAGAGGSKHPSHPSQGSQEDDTADKSNISGATDESTAPVSCPSHPSQDDEKGADLVGDSGSSPQARPQENETSPGVLSDEGVTEAVSAGQVQTAPHAVQGDSDNPNEFPITEFPPGVPVRRRRPPKPED